MRLFCIFFIALLVIASAKPMNGVLESILPACFQEYLDSIMQYRPFDMASFIDNSLHSAGQKMREFFPNIIDYVPGIDAKKVIITWYLQPEQHIVEFILLNLICIPLTLSASNPSFWSPAVPRIPYNLLEKSGKLLSKASPSYALEKVKRIHLAFAPISQNKVLRWLDLALSVMSWFCMLATVWYKTRNGRELYLLQPCHLSNMILVFLTLARSKSYSRLFYFYIGISFGAVLAITNPDTRGLGEHPHCWYEVEMFFIQHAMLILLPAIWIVRRKYDLFGGFFPLLWTWTTFFLIHVNIFLPVSLLSTNLDTEGRNINYMMVPPKGPVRALKEYYRMIFSVVCLGFAFLMRFVYYAFFLYASGTNMRVEQEKELFSLLFSPMQSSDTLVHDAAERELISFIELVESGGLVSADAVMPSKSLRIDTSYDEAQASTSSPTLPNPSLSPNDDTTNSNPLPLASSRSSFSSPKKYTHVHDPSFNTLQSPLPVSPVASWRKRPANAPSAPEPTHSIMHGQGESSIRKRRGSVL